ncbi:MAG: hypothetical protein JXB18_06345 [Sedimentisphaerales bacterium]|nr:hypothetical protein [Sedimentisphaerales bacterium]
MSKTQSNMKKTTITIKEAKCHSVTRSGNIDIIKERILADIMQVYRQNFSTEELHDLHWRLTKHFQPCVAMMAAQTS